MTAGREQDARATLRALSEAATPGPWAVPVANVFRVIAPDAPHTNPPQGMTPPYCWAVVADTGQEATAAADAAFIAAAVNYVRAALLPSPPATTGAGDDELRRAVLALHYSETWGVPDAEPICPECSYDARQIEYPCPTARAVDFALSRPGTP